MIGIRDYDIVLKSSQGTQNAGANNSMTFTFDWSILEDKPYELTFNYACEAFTTTTTTCVGCITTDLNLGSNYQNSVSTVQSAPYSNILGMISSGTGTTGVTYLYADANTNEHIFLLGRPEQKTFTINICQLDGSTVNAGITTEKWVLIIHLKDATKNYGNVKGELNRGALR
jgi:hypothetical protein